MYTSIITLIIIIIIDIDIVIVIFIGLQVITGNNIGFSGNAKLK